MHTEETPVKVLLEQIDAKIKIIREGHGELWKRTGVTNVKLERLEEQFKFLEIRVNVLDKPSIGSTRRSMRSARG